MEQITDKIINMKNLFLLLLTFYSNYSMSQSESYPIQFEDSLTILFPAEPEITENSDFSKTYNVETTQGTFTVLIHRNKEPLLLSDSLIDLATDLFSADFFNDPNLGALSNTDQIVIGNMRGKYMRFEVSTVQPASFIMYLRLSSSKSPNTYSIAYRYQDRGGKPLYDKESFLASIKD